MTLPARVAILTSGIGLGVYMPALLIEQRLRRAGIDVSVEVLEGSFSDAHQQRHLAHKDAYHSNFDLALVAHRMARGVEDSLEPARVRELLARWADSRTTRFVVWSGFWLPILDRFQREVATPLEIDACRIDAVVSASFRVHEGIALDAREIWLWHWDDRRTVYEIPVDERPPLPFAARSDRLVVHGGGWGLGTYRDVAAAMRDTGFAFDVVVHATEEANDRRDGDRYFMVERTWRPWHTMSSRHGFPPFGEVGAPPRDSGRHDLYEHIRRSKAIVSKPGGGTLIDSLSSATPVVLLEPYGYAEAKNGELWEHLGYGISYARWQATGFDPRVLEQLHDNLVARPRGPDYPADLIARLGEGAA